ncbi:type II restriction endonuclease [Allopontixanthobacter sp.]|uniref:type II restriction endonuclease n=1 Tax=Allopontixanthobacter sp. TaxID=2906452 RepID=UPI002AB80A27|nr:type II restriction endonuclease [Allopontixanthobacter sp.]MDZ4308202.1 type II restriction endonuclease [Allopontixanthobacter sp.]
MRRGNLSEYFTGVVVKDLSEVETNPKKSNQHEFNGSAALRALLGSEEPLRIPTKFLWIGAEQEQVEAIDGTLTWYDSRRDTPGRTEYRLYYESNSITDLIAVGDSFFLALRNDKSALAVFTPTDGTMYNQLLWLFGVEHGNQASFVFQPVTGTDQGELDFAARSVLEAIAVEPEEAELDLIENLTEKFGVNMPRPAILSVLARESIGTEVALDDPDRAIVDWMERETQLFRRIERRIVSERISEGFYLNGNSDVDSFISFSLSVQNRRKSRAGLALESHIGAVLDAHAIKYARGAVTENGNKPDFLFPGDQEYRDLKFPSAGLTMLGAKSSIKERWRQVLSEAERITPKHLLTLEPSISEAQTDEMQAKNLRLVVPRGIHKTFKPLQQSWLYSFSDFIELVRGKEL